MKRLLVVILSLVYLAAGAGFTMRQHYCMGQHVGTAIDHPADDADNHKCDRCGMERKRDGDGCCKDKVQTFKSSPDQIAAKALPALPAPIAAMLPVSFPAAPHAPVADVNALPAAPAHGPPLRSGTPLYLRIRCLRL